MEKAYEFFVPDPTITDGKRPGYRQVAEMTPDVEFAIITERWTRKEFDERFVYVPDGPYPLCGDRGPHENICVEPVGHSGNHAGMNGVTWTEHEFPFAEFSPLNRIPK